MMRLFLRIMYSTFLWIILLANLFIAFDLVQNLATYGISANLNPITQDMTNRYFGISNIIQGFQNMDKDNVGKFVSSVGNYQKSIYAYGSDLMTRGFNTLNANENYFGGGTNIIDWVKGIFNTIGGIALMITSWFTYTWGFLVLIFYYLMLIFSISYMILFWFTGVYSTELPSTITPAIQSVGNCITPLLTAV